MSLIPQLLRLLLVLLMPLWLSLAVDALGLHLTMPSMLSGLRRAAPDADTTLAPPSGWRERAYLAANPDVAAAVRDGVISSGYAHYVQHGRAEGRLGGFRETPAVKKAELVKAEAPPAAPPPVPVPAPPPKPILVEPPAQPAADPVRPAVKPIANGPITNGPITNGAVTTLPAKPAAGERPTVERIRTANSEAGVRVVLDLDRAPRFETPVRRPDGRLEVALPGTLWQAAAAGRLPPTTLGYSVERDGTGSRLLLGTDESGSGAGSGAVRLIGVSTLPPDKDRGHRLLIDVALADKGKGR
ncbi:hypothetical protein [Azospirillum sp. TSO35-2]|uniref:hypothetical protein n=1 Tax=Azospirillum sp. TSO35-2 TaxID=716796 RepID=UPI000D65B6C1|nr:hypothetical protein [Azospirillum sp. TSO35-2]